MDLITKDSEITLVLFSSLDRVLENVEYMVMNYRPVLNGEHYLTGDEVCKRLCISKRTLHPEQIGKYSLSDSSCRKSGGWKQLFET